MRKLVSCERFSDNVHCEATNEAGASMSKQLLCAMILSAIIAHPAIAKPKTRAEKIADAKASIEQMADETAITLYQKRAASPDKPYVSMELHRRVGRWLAAGFSIGMCEQHAKPTLVADWLSRIDGLANSMGDVTGEAQRALQSTGNDLRRTGQQHSMTDNQTPANGARLCDIELEATRQILQTL